MERRKFLQLPLAAVPLIAAKGALAQTAKQIKVGRIPTALKVKLPVAVSTWDSGMTANAGAWPILKGGGSALNAVEAAGIAIENEPSCCVGLQAWPDRDGKVTLDSSIMNGNGDCGAVSYLERIKHPVSVARKVMELTPHILLSGSGAQQFALDNGFTLESDELSDEAKKEWQEWLRRSKYKPEINIENRKKISQIIPPYRFDDGSFNHDTMATLAIDKGGKLAGMVTTSGMAFKMRGRVGDSPIIGAGLFVDDEVGGAVSSGVGEEVIRICGTHTVIEQMRLGRTPQEACREAIRRIVRRDPEKTKEMQVGFVAVSRKGEIGAFSIQKDFTFSITNAEFPNGEVMRSNSWF